MSEDDNDRGFPKGVIFVDTQEEEEAPEAGQAFPMDPLRKDVDESRYELPEGAEPLTKESMRRQFLKTNPRYSACAEDEGKNELVRMLFDSGAIEFGEFVVGIPVSTIGRRFFHHRDGSIRAGMGKGAVNAGHTVADDSLVRSSASRLGFSVYDLMNPWQPPEQDWGVTLVVGVNPHYLAEMERRAEESGLGIEYHIEEVLAFDISQQGIVSRRLNEWPEGIVGCEIVDDCTTLWPKDKDERPRVGFGGIDYVVVDPSSPDYFGNIFHMPGFGFQGRFVPLKIHNDPPRHDIIPLNELNQSVHRSPAEIEALVDLASQGCPPQDEECDVRKLVGGSQGRALIEVLPPEIAEEGLDNYLARNHMTPGDLFAELDRDKDE